jgi:asparagine synthase (glutamine-hydrolysing)
MHQLVESGLDELSIVEANTNFLALASAGLSASRRADGVAIIGSLSPFSDQRADVARSSEREQGFSRLRRLYNQSVAFDPTAFPGDFHFVLWDAQRRRLTCSRDRLGVRPLFYRDFNDFIAVASNLRLLTKLGVEPPRPEEASIRRFLAAEGPAENNTYIRGVRRLAPGATLVREDSKLRVDAAAAFVRPSVRGRSDAAADFRETFEKAVRVRLGSADETASMLSGGLDSSAIVMIASDIFARSSSKPLRSVSIVFDATPEWNERKYIEEVLRAARCRATIVDAGGYAPFENFGEVLAEQGGLFLAPGLPLSRRVYALAASAGVKVLLDGHGGDEVVSQGWGRLHDLALEGAWLKLTNEVRDIYHGGRRDWHTWLLFYLKYGPLRKPVSMAHRLRSRFRRATGERQSRNSMGLMLPSQHSLFLEERGAPPVFEPPPGLSHEANDHYENLTDPGQAIALETLDASATAAGIEPRYPFWDADLINLCLSLESREKLEQGWSRLVMRRALPEIPAMVRWRRDKLDFSPHLAGGFLQHHRDLLDAIFRQRWRSLEISEYVDFQAAGAAYHQLLTKGPATGGAALQTIWRVVALALWLDTFGGNELDELTRSTAAMA